MLPLHKLLGTMLQILGRIECQQQQQHGGSSGSNVAVIPYRISVSQWLLELFQAQQQQQQQQQQQVCTTWNAFLWQAFRFFAGISELQVISHPTRVAPHISDLTPHTSHLTPHTSHLTPHTSHLTPHTSPHSFLPLFSATFGNSTASQREQPPLCRA
jgi:hypothetical protein